jgi:hypothetical protein
MKSSKSAHKVALRVVRPSAEEAEVARLKALCRVGAAINVLDRGIDLFPVDKRSKIAELMRGLEIIEAALDSLGGNQDGQ